MNKAIFKLSSQVIVGILLTCATLSSCAQGNASKKVEENKNQTNKASMKKSDEEWKKQLSPEQYYVLREKGTERPHTGKFNMHFEEGNYTCAACGNVLFDSESKFDSHCGWPSFDKEVGKGNIKTVTDKSHGMTRTEIMCAKCDGHLGHVFDDGPTKTGLRYCVNSLSLEFVPANEEKKKEDANKDN